MLSTWLLLLAIRRVPPLKVTLVTGDAGTLPRPWSASTERTPASSTTPPLKVLTDVSETVPSPVLVMVREPPLSATTHPIASTAPGLATLNVPLAASSNPSVPEPAGLPLLAPLKVKVVLVALAPMESSGSFTFPVPPRVRMLLFEPEVLVVSVIGLFVLMTIAWTERF